MRPDCSADRSLPAELRLISMLRLSIREVKRAGKSALAPLSLSPVQYAIMADLNDAGRAIPQKEFALRYALSSGRCLREIIGLADRGMVRRTPADGGPIVELTEHGESILSAATAMVGQSITEMSRRFPEMEWEYGVRFLLRLSGMVCGGRRLPQPVMFPKRVGSSRG